MSIDTIDDLEAAEDFAAAAADLLARIAPHAVTVDGDPSLKAEAEALALTWANYCRPSCEANGEPGICDDDTCGCPCGHTEVEADEDGILEL